MRSLDDFKDQAFYWEACRLQAEQRDRLGADNNERRSNVVFLSEYRRSKRAAWPATDESSPKPAS